MINEQYMQLLQALEKHFDTALKCGYVRGLTRKEMDDLNIVYKFLYDTEPFGNGCSKCMLKAMKRIAKEYYDTKEILEHFEEHNDNDNDNPKDDNPIEQSYDDDMYLQSNSKDDFAELKNNTQPKKKNNKTKPNKE